MPTVHPPQLPRLGGAPAAPAEDREGERGGSPWCRCLCAPRILSRLALDSESEPGAGPAPLEAPLSSVGCGAVPNGPLPGLSASAVEGSGPTLAPRKGTLSRWRSVDVLELSSQIMEEVRRGAEVGLHPLLAPCWHPLLFWSFPAKSWTTTLL